MQSNLVAIDYLSSNLEMLVTLPCGTAEGEAEMLSMLQKGLVTAVVMDTSWVGYQKSQDCNYAQVLRT
jgi:predicted DNA-binding transcriptional regulator